MKRIVEERGFIFVDREKSRQFLIEANMNNDQLTAVILGLSVGDCFDGPESDRDPRYAANWTVAEFRPTYKGQRLYLKMSIRHDPDYCKCLSVKPYLEERP